MHILLDTNAYSHLLKGDQQVLEEMNRASGILMSVFVLGELYSGFKGESKETENVTLLRKFLLKPLIRVVDATLTTSEIYSEIKNSLKTAGTPIPINDVWIAGHVIESGAQLITYDQHFKKIKDMSIWDKL